MHRIYNLCQEGMESTKASGAVGVKTSKTMAAAVAPLKAKEYCPPNIYTVPSMVDSPATFEMAALNSALDNFPSPEIKMN